MVFSISADGHRTNSWISFDVASTLSASSCSSAHMMPLSMSAHWQARASSFFCTLASARFWLA